MQSRISASPNLQSERAMDFSFLSRIYRAPYSKCVDLIEFRRIRSGRRRGAGVPHQSLSCGGTCLYRIRRWTSGSRRYGPIGFPFFIPQLDMDVDVASRVAGPSINVLGILPVTDGFELFARAASYSLTGCIRCIWEWPRSQCGGTLDLGRRRRCRITRRWSARFAYENVEDLQRTVYTVLSALSASYSVNLRFLMRNPGAH